MSVPGEAIPQEEKGPSATQSEKIAAFNALKPEQYGRLLKFAEWTAGKLRGRVNDSDGEDLFQQSVMRALYKRNWYPQKVDFLMFVKGCIRSTASQWYEGAQETEPPDELLSLTRHDAQAEAAITIEKIREALKDRPHAVEIFDLKCEGLTAQEIQERLGIRKEIYDAAVKWIERTLRKEGFR